jgi:chromosome segregation ATPase
MSYEPRYKGWVEKQTKKDAKTGEAKKLVEVYRGIPIVQEKINDDPVEYRLRFPRGTARDIKKIRKRIDKQIDSPPVSKPRASAEDYEGLYRQKFEESQKELVTLQRRYNLTESKMEEFQSKIDKLSGEVSRLKEESKGLRRKLDEANKLIKEKNLIK